MATRSEQGLEATAKPRIPVEFSDPTAWAAWLYFVDELTQSEVAKAIGVSRVTVIKLLNEAKDQGLASVRINPRLLAGVSASRRLSELWGLNSTVVIPDNPDRPLVERLGQAGAMVLQDSLEPGDTVGIAWGRTVLAAAHNLTQDKPIKDLTLVQLSASPNGLSADFSPELCVSLSANKLGARSVSLMAPAIVSSPELKAMLLDEPSIRNQLDVIRSANKALFGIGQLNADATLRESELHTGAIIDEMIGQGAVGAILGRFLGADGAEMAGPTNDRMIGLSLEEFKMIPKRICLAGGPVKFETIRAALLGGYVTDLVIDLSTAELLIQDAEARV